VLIAERKRPLGPTARGQEGYAADFRPNLQTVSVMEDGRMVRKVLVCQVHRALVKTERSPTYSNPFYFLWRGNHGPSRDFRVYASRRS